MEKKDSLKNFIIIVLLILLIGLGLYVGYNNLLNNKCDSDTSELDKTCEDTAKVFYTNMVKNREVIEQYDEGISILLDKDGNVYYSASSLNNPVGTKGEYKIDGYTAGPGDDGNGLSNIFKGYKLDVSNVVAIYGSAVGNGGFFDYILIKADGTIAKLTYLPHKNTDYESVVTIESFEETVPGFKNIISIEKANGWDAYSYRLIDIDGNFLYPGDTNN